MHNIKPHYIPTVHSLYGMVILSTVGDMWFNISCCFSIGSYSRWKFLVDLLMK